MAQIHWPPPAFQVMIKPAGPVCNLDCCYCYYLHKESLYPNSSFRIGIPTLEVFTRDYIAAQRIPEITFTWQGGEPTLVGLDFFEQAIALQNKYRRPGMYIHNALQTNGTLLDDDWCRFFKKHNFLIGLSLDGPMHMHDAFRLDKAGRPTFDRVMKGLALLKKHGVDFNILTCIHAANADFPLDVYRFLRDEVEAQFIQFIPVVERHKRKNHQENARITRRSVSGRQYGRFLTTVFDEWIRADVGRIFVQIFDVALGVWYGQPASLCIFSDTCGTALALEHNGDLYACDHFVDPDHILGSIGIQNLAGLVSGQEQKQFGQNKQTSLPHYCKECAVRFVCNGGCPKNRVQRTPGGENGLNHLCEGYRAFFTHIDTPMKIMARLLRMGRAPADIMNQYK